MQRRRNRRSGRRWLMNGPLLLIFLLYPNGLSAHYGKNMANETQLLANLLFSETKDVDDAKAIASVVVNRMKRPERFGQTLEDVVFAPKQFSGVGGNEWNKIISGKLTKDEEDIYKHFLAISSGVLKGTIQDDTKGADHYFNPKLAHPSWAKKMKKTYTTDYHNYYKE